MSSYLCVANWKANLTPDQEYALAQEINAELQRKPVPQVEVVLAPSFVSLAAIAHTAEQPLSLAAQDCYGKESGAATGEVIPAALAQVGCRYVIIGHSERRTLLGETNEMVAQKYAVLIETQKKLGLTPIICIGETAQQRDKGVTRAILEEQLSDVLAAVPLKAHHRLVIAYEPIWAISTNQQGAAKHCQPRDCKEAVNMIDEIVHTAISGVSREAVRIIYGGSVDEHNVTDYVQEGGVQGVLVGGASLQSKRLCAIVQALNTAL